MRKGKAGSRGKGKSKDDRARSAGRSAAGGRKPSGASGRRGVSKAKAPVEDVVNAGGGQQNARAPKIKLKGKVYDRVPFKPEDADWLCIDCEAPQGQIHELGCDTEECPRCGGQLIGCGCLPEQ